MSAPSDEVIAAVQERVQASVKALQEGRFVDAMRAAEGAASYGVDFPGLHYLRAICFNNVGRHEEALAACEKELIINPSNAEARQELENLKQALRREKPRQLQISERSYQTKLPFDTMMSIQGGLHNYTYRGTPMLKNPFDVALYPMLIWALKPKTIFEIGSKNGGSALWFGDTLKTFGIEGHVHSFDIVKVEDVSHPLVTFHEANGRALHETVTPEFMNSCARPFLVIEDADHAYQTSIAVLDFFHPYLRSGEYIVVEDGIVSDISKDPTCSNGPHRAIKEFVARYPNQYVMDAEYCDFFGYNFTWCTNGFLKKL